MLLIMLVVFILILASLIGYKNAMIVMAYISISMWYMVVKNNEKYLLLKMPEKQRWLRRNTHAWRVLGCGFIIVASTYLILAFHIAIAERWWVIAQPLQTSVITMFNYTFVFIVITKSLEAIRHMAKFMAVERFIAIKQ